MNRHPFSDSVTDDSMFKKVFFRHYPSFSPLLPVVTVHLLYIIYIYCHKCHKCHCPLKTGLSSVTVSNCFLSSVTTFPFLGTASRGLLSSVLCSHLATLYAGACL